MGRRACMCRYNHTWIQPVTLVNLGSLQPGLLLHPWWEFRFCFETRRGTAKVWGGVVGVRKTSYFKLAMSVHADSPCARTGADLSHRSTPLDLLWIYSVGCIQHLKCGDVYTQESPLVTGAMYFLWQHGILGRKSPAACAIHRRPGSPGGW